MNEKACQALLVRRQEVVFIGASMDEAAISAQLDEALLTPEVSPSIPHPILSISWQLLASDPALQSLPPISSTPISNLLSDERCALRQRDQGTSKRLMGA